MIVDESDLKAAVHVFACEIQADYLYCIVSVSVRVRCEYAPNLNQSFRGRASQWRTSCHYQVLAACGSDIDRTCFKISTHDVQNSDISNFHSGSRCKVSAIPWGTRRRSLSM